ncbi:aminoglycoside phosphotransferase family protein [Planomonospora sp. ID82291]|uniref:aminoglycoside phosphotransferase family protein n=1 Tax=Planomonospora sp. ID82291 TaxID=2738136 RepID=UPI0018C3BE30|nr:aminoglycoside phosphotransferase family protein [Planomonospora sp. ID82291]MBG0814161.1 aminoglycoside phosphotransferase family protein [Planomonospora sp. ID82291]
MNESQTTIPTFTVSAARETLDAACREVGLHAEDAILLRLGENAIFQLSRDNVIVRIARSAEVLPDARKEVAVAEWLRESGLPAAEPADYEQPLMTRGRPVTFWRLIENNGDKASVRDLARILRRLHSLPVPPEIPLPEFDIFGRVSERIANTEALSDQDHEFLTARLIELREKYESLRYPLSPCAVHGDAHQQNLIVALDGRVLLIDFERFAFGPPETDLAVTATERLIGWHTAGEYESFTDAYGFDIISWEGFPILRSINELKMTTWLMQNVNESERVAQEFRTRFASLHDDEAPRSWAPF